MAALRPELGQAELEAIGFGHGFTMRWYRGVRTTRARIDSWYPPANSDVGRVKLKSQPICVSFAADPHTAAEEKANALLRSQSPIGGLLAEMGGLLTPAAITVGSVELTIPGGSCLVVMPHDPYLATYLDPVNVAAGHPVARLAAARGLAWILLPSAVAFAKPTSPIVYDLHVLVGLVGQPDLSDLPHPTHFEDELLYP